MSHKFLSLAALAALVSVSFSACDDDDDDNKNDNAVQVASIDCDASNASNWGNYMKAVAKGLKDDAATLYADWNDNYDDLNMSFAAYFKSQPAAESAQEIVGGCVDIANEVGDAKIGEPLDLWNAGRTTEAVLAVESWYSWHSRDDYSNNILSIRNSYYGSRDNSVSDKSLSALVKSLDPDFNTRIVNAIDNAYNKILDIPQPFRNNIASQEAADAQTACGELTSLLKSLQSKVVDYDNDKLAIIVNNYVDVVVLPTYKDLADKNAALYATAEAFAANPSTEAFATCAAAWLAAREPWEKSEAFLFGPVGDKGLDPNMDSWPLDQAGIEAVIKSGDFSGMNWSGEFDEDNDNIASAQSLRGFHTLEFLIFKDGKPRTY